MATSIPTNFHGISADELHASCLALGLTMKAKASVVVALAQQQAQQAKEAAESAAGGESAGNAVPPPPPAPAAAVNDDFFVTMHPAITLRPITSCPVPQFEDLQNKQPLWNILIDMLARHPTFLAAALADTAASDAGFTGRMLQMYSNIYLKGGGAAVYQPNMLGIFRNDYMEESASPATAANTNTYEHSSAWKQVEINTISVSFAGLAPKVGKFHQQVGHVAKNEVARRRSTALAPGERIHIGESDKVVPGALAAGARRYLNWREEKVGASSPTSSPSYVPVVCFVIQENERNTTDQYMLSFEVETAHNVRCIRRTLRELKEGLALVPPAANSSAAPLPPLAIVEGTYEVTVFYFRSCYTPTDFPTEAQWDARRLIEESAAVKCPSLPYYLCTFKKVQQLITGSRVRAEGTPAPATPPSGSNTPTVARSPTVGRSAARDFATAAPAQQPSEPDHIQQLIKGIIVSAADASKARLAAEFPPTGARRGAKEKPFSVSASYFYAPAGEGLDAADGNAVAASAINEKSSYELTYFTPAGASAPASAGASALAADWYTNWVRCNFVPIYSLNPKENPNAEAVIADAIANPRNYVLKPQLEGGGNLYSGDEMVTLLRITKPAGDDEGTLTEPEREFLQTYWRVRNEYILMRRINVKKHSCDEVMSGGGGSSRSPASLEGEQMIALEEEEGEDASPLFRMGQIISKSQVRSACVGINHQPNDDLCSELGIYGVILTDGPVAVSPAGAEAAEQSADSFSSLVAPTTVRVLLNDSAGYVIRSKLASVDDGGVMAGAAFLDSIALRSTVVSV